MCAEQIKGGRLARQAAMLCQDPMFQLYLDRRRRAKFGIEENALPDGTHNAEDARDWICAACQIESRAMLDHDYRAASIFHVIRKRYQQWRLKLKK